MMNDRALSEDTRTEIGWESDGFAIAFHLASSLPSRVVWCSTILLYILWFETLCKLASRDRLEMKRDERNLSLTNPTHLGSVSFSGICGWCWLVRLWWLFCEIKNKVFIRNQRVGEKFSFDDVVVVKGEREREASFNLRFLNCPRSLFRFGI